MCGISGYINLKSYMREIGYEQLEDLKKAVRIQHHRGPDDNGVCAFSFLSKEVYPAMDPMELQKYPRMNGVLGFNRLSIKDLSIEGHQPMISEDRNLIILFNGEIYNDQKLRNSLLQKGYTFKGHSDTEVILKMIIEYGFEQTIERLNGMFAICAIDLSKGLINMARDRFGIKPFYFSIVNDRLIFASEIKALIQFRDFERELDIAAANARLLFSRSGHDVLMKDIELLKPGCILSIRYDGDISQKRYFDLNQYSRKSSFKNIDEALDAAEVVLSEAVSRQMVSDVKVGCQLSGGIDSTLVTYYANKLSKGKLNDTVSIIDEKRVIGEEEYIDYVSKKLNVNSHKFDLSEKYFFDNYEKMIWHNDAPVYRPFFSCFMNLAENAKQHVTVLLSGEGSDEIAGGYSRFTAGIYYPFISQFNGSETIKKYGTYAEYVAMAGDTCTGLTVEGTAESTVKEMIERKMNIYDTFTGTNFTKHLKFEIYECLPEVLLRQDKMTMAASIENRVPLLDNEVVNFIMELPEEYLVQFKANSPMLLSANPFEWVQGKFIFKELVAKHFGHDFAYRKKMIMALDERRMLSSPHFTNYYHDLILPGLKNRGLLDAKKVDGWFQNIHTISNKEYLMMWRAISLETWCQLFLDKQHC